MAGGKKTSYGGKILEQAVCSFKLKNFEIINAEQFRDRNGLFRDERLLVKNFPYETLFGTPGRREYFLKSSEWQGHLECKYQNGSGSVDEKIVYVVETLRRTEMKALIIIHGGNWWEKKRGKEVIRWAKEQSLSLMRDYGKELLCFDLDGLMDWINRIYA